MGLEGGFLQGSLMLPCSLSPTDRGRIMDPVCPLDLSPAEDTHLHWRRAPNLQSSRLLDTPSLMA